MIYDVIKRIINENGNTIKENVVCTIDCSSIEAQYIASTKLHELAMYIKKTYTLRGMFYTCKFIIVPRETLDIKALKGYILSEINNTIKDINSVIKRQNMALKRSNYINMQKYDILDYIKEDEQNNVYKKDYCVVVNDVILVE